MNEKYQSRLELFIMNIDKIKKSFMWQNILLKRLAALLYAAQDKVVDCDAIDDSCRIIKENTGLFSAFRGNSSFCIAAMLSLSSDKNLQFSNTLAAYDIMKKTGFRASDCLVIAAYQIAANSEVYKFNQVAERAKTFYDGMKKEHYFITGQDDYIFAAMLGLSDINIEIGTERMKQLYNILKPEFLSGNGVQALTQVLVLGEQTTEAADRVLALRDAFRKEGLRLDRTNTLSSLGVLSLLPADIETVINDVAQVYGFLRTQRGFGSLSISKEELLLLSSSFVAFRNVDDAKSNILTSAISTSITNIIIAQQAAISAAVAASAAAAASSST